jgi:hypothetical protein
MTTAAGAETSICGGTRVPIDTSVLGTPFANLTLGGNELGTVGTDFLSLHSLEFHYEPSQPFAALGSEACDPATLHRAGFVAVGLPGYYATDLSRLKNGMPNVPVIGLRIGQVTFPTQMDTGYGDFPKGVIQVNAALMKILRASGIPMHPVPSDVVTVGCSGSYAYERWQIEREDLSIITPGGLSSRATPRPCSN